MSGGDFCSSRSMDSLQYVLLIDRGLLEPLQYFRAEIMPNIWFHYHPLQEFTSNMGPTARYDSSTPLTTTIQKLITRPSYSVQGFLTA